MLFSLFPSCYAWKPIKDAPFQVTYDSQSDSTKQEFQKRKDEAVVLMAQQGLNVVPYYENTDFRKWISIVPTSAITGEGSAAETCMSTLPSSLFLPLSPASC